MIMKKTLIFLLVMAVALTSTPALAAQAYTLPWRAAHVGEYAYRLESGDIYFHATDRARTSTKFYQTGGYTFTRAYPGTRTADDDTYVTIKRDLDLGHSQIDLGGGLIQTGFTISGEYLEGQVDRYGYRDWLNELVGGGAETWMIIDAIVFIGNDAAPDEHMRISGWIIDDSFNQNYFVNPFFQMYP